MWITYHYQSRAKGFLAGRVEGVRLKRRLLRHGTLARLLHCGMMVL